MACLVNAVKTINWADTLFKYTSKKFSIITGLKMFFSPIKNNTKLTHKFVVNLLRVHY